jgi:hypothetical protein
VGDFVWLDALVIPPPSAPSWVADAPEGGAADETAAGAADLERAPPDVETVG